MPIIMLYRVHTLLHTFIPFSHCSPSKFHTLLFSIHPFKFLRSKSLLSNFLHTSFSSINSSANILVLFSCTTTTNPLVENYRPLKYKTTIEALLFAAEIGAAVQAKGNFLKYKETFVSSCTEQNIIGTCVYDQSSCLPGHWDFVQPNLFQIICFRY
jgi:hypothetical protein